MVGAYLDDDLGTDSGSVYVYKRDASGLWSEVQKITASDGEPDDIFGHNVDISGERLIVGAEMSDRHGSESGSAYVFELDEAGVWREIRRLSPSDLDIQDRFGRAVAIDGDTAIIGAYLGDDLGFEAGSAYVYELSTAPQAGE